MIFRAKREGERMAKTSRLQQEKESSRVYGYLCGYKDCIDKVKECVDNGENIEQLLNKLNSYFTEFNNNAKV